MILDRSDSNAPNQASRFTLHIRSLKEATLTREGKTDTLKTFTVDSPIPFLMTDLLELLKDDDTRKGMGKALYNFERIAKEGRKYGVSILAVSQRPADVSKTILSQCNNFVVLRLTNERDKGVIKNLLPDSLKSTIEFLPLLDVGEALVVGDAILLPSKIVLDKPLDTHRPISATKDFWDEWDNNEPDNDAINEAIEALRKQCRG